MNEYEKNYRDWVAREGKKWVESYFKPGLSTYHLQNLYDLLHENYEDFNNGDWYAELSQACVIGLVLQGVDKFTANSGRNYTFAYIVSGGGAGFIPDWQLGLEPRSSI